MRIEIKIRSTNGENLVESEFTGTSVEIETWCFEIIRSIKESTFEDKKG